MTRLVSLVCVATILMMTRPAQAQRAQTQDDMSISEFRQVLLDLGSYLDAHKNTDVRRRFEAVPDETLSVVYSHIANPRQFQSAVAALRQHDAMQSGRQSRTQSATFSPPALQSLATFPACSPNTIIDSSPGAACTPAYPDPNNSAWQNLVNPIITFGAFSPTDYPSVSSQACGLTVEANLSQVSSALQGTVLAASAVCGAIPDPGGNICWGVNAVFSIAAATSFGLFSDCQEQDGLVQSAEVNAAFHNTVTIYNKAGAIDTHLTNVNNQITSEFSALDTHLTNVDNHIAAEFVALDSHMVSLFNQLSTQLTNATELSTAQLKQVMKLLLTPEGQRELVPAILTCNGPNCPNVLAQCPAAGCSWNRVGPLP